ncbi:glycerol-3-phosphate 1-O-acyltransferase PlsY [Sulfurihydrogenibium azorense]|uniref:glycerol-3-phosphate 1-O-acyltransferase PlsY n=1 Tax=Sulfurihydrogenibium azorense TaxID=309806 RepID=UPI00240A6D70|nr:glycerol-3-phosphate 1-O-acyltransferase PlsY [Sulfurihydrogenibium azorense]MDM7274346.1 glycerol-3-phosphate 1-O-acyltransferase PlsY [Sulfurihydrogenibium azorense]
MEINSFFIYVLITYLIGSIPFGLIVGKIFGKDVRKEGSGNIGATNVTRVIGKKAGILVLLLDALKGFFPVYIAKYYFPSKYVSIIALTAVIGHCFSIYLKFKGGKGVATAFGVLLALSLKVALIVLTFWLGVFLTTGYVSLASVLSAGISWSVIYVLLDDIYYTFAGFFIAIIIIFKHKSNLDRFLEGKENRFIYK